MRSVRELSICILWAICALLGTSTVSADVGFQPYIKDTTLTVVSFYDQPDYSFSAAINPTTHRPLSNLLMYLPQVERVDGVNSTITFNTRFYKGTAMVPVTLGALQYFQYRSDKYVQSEFAQGFNQSRRAGRQGGARQGINIGFDKLPKRFDRIFGEGGANLKITGYRRITFSGRSQWQDGAESDLFTQNKFPSLDMQQISRFDITGTIGSKITVSVSQDSQTDIPLANRLQIRYKGDDDDILRSVEAGNTNLSLPNTRFVGYSSRIQGLFGIKAEAQVGALKITAIASQEKGSTEKASISAAGESSAQVIRDKDYETSRIYDLTYNDFNRPNDAYDVFRASDRVIKLVVYEEEDKARDPTATEARLLVDPRQPEAETFQRRVTLDMVEVERDQYRWYDDAGTNQHYVVFNSRRPDTKARAVYIEVERKLGGTALDTIPIGNIQVTANDTLVLMTLQARASEYDPQHPTWELMWRNTYRIPRGVSANDLEIQILKALPGREGTSESLDYQLDENGQTEGYYLTILGLDQYNLSNQKVPDNILDARDEVFRGDDWGLIVFPSRKPFDSDTTFTDENGRETAPMRTRVETLYDYVSQSEKVKNSEYYIRYVTRERSNIIRLNRVNIIEGSEVVIVNGNQLQRGTHYNIDYDFGQITLLVDEATDPNAEISVDYEYAPFLAVQKKTLLGLRAEYEWSKDLSFGTTLLYKSDKAQDRKPRVGQETAKMLVLDFDMNFRLYPNFLTKAVNALPMMDTETESRMAVSAEVAQSRPNPNVEDVAYVDDFESALDRVSLGMNRTNWSLAAAPESMSDASSWMRGRMLWHRPYRLPLREDVFTINADNVPQGESVVQTLRLIFRHAHTPGNDQDSSWAGIIRPFEGRIDADRAQELKIRLFRNRRPINGKLHLDFGVIDEDVNGDGISFGEDDRPQGDENRVVSDLEDTGLDGLFDEAEPNYDAATNPDPEGDNWYFLNNGDCPVGSLCDDPVIQDRFDNPDDDLYFEWLNGTEGNRVDAAQAAKPDQERLTGTFSDASNNSYFSFEIDISDTSRSATFLDTGSFSADNNWVTYTIPIRDPDNYTTVGTVEPRWNQVQHVRVWIEVIDTLYEPRDTLDLGLTQLPVLQDTLEIAEWYIVQSAWDDTVWVNDSVPHDPDEEPKFVVSSVTEEDGTFSAPPGVEPYRDPQQNVEETQRGLSLRYEDLKHGDTAFASRTLITAEAYSGYRSIEMYVYGDAGLPPTGDTTTQFIFRMGRDMENFYEFRTVGGLYPGWDERNYVAIDFNEITGLKDAAIRDLESGERVDTLDNQYRVVGGPNFNQIKFFAFGVAYNDALSDSVVSGELWVDELRVTGVRRDVGTAARMTMSGNVADLINYNVSYQYKNPYFRGISTATRGGSSNNLGSGQTERNLAWNVSMNLDKFAPRSWGARLPVTFSFNRTTRLPLLKNNSDIVLPEEARELEKSTAESRSFSISESFNRKGSNPLFSVLLNRQNLRFSYSRARQKSVNRPYYLGENYSISASYQAGLSKPPKLPILFWAKKIPVIKGLVGREITFYPDRWSFQGQMTRSLSVSEDSDRQRISSLKRDFAGSMDLNYKPMDILSTSFKYSTKRDLSDPDLVNVSLNPNRLKLGLETNYSNSFSMSYDPTLFSFITAKFSFNSNYKDSYQRSNETRRSDMSQSWKASGRFDHMQLFSPGSGGRQRSSRARADTTKPFYDKPLAVLRFLTGWIRPLSYGYSESYSNSLPGMVTRPGLTYRLGLIREAEVDTLSVGRSRFARETESYNVSSGFTFLGGITTDVRLSRSISRDVVRVGTRTESKQTTWPDLSIRISRFQTLPLIKGVVNKFIAVFSPRTGFSRDIKEDYNLSDGFKTNETISTNHNPLISVNFKVFRNLSVSGSYVLAKSTVKKFNRVDGSLDNEAQSTRKTIGVSSRFSFTAPSGIGIPLFGKVKFRSTVAIELNVRYGSNKTENSDRGLPFRVTTDKSDLTISPVISYTFSQQIKGGLTARWQDSNDAKFDRKSHVRELQIWSEIRF